ncbi:MAG: hypothetical protein ACRDZX_09715, partial [Acidimicrobiales bacterium]
MQWSPPLPLHAAPGPGAPAAASKAPRVVFVGHEATFTGAPISLLRLLEWLRAQACFQISLVLLQGGPLLPQYKDVCPTTVVRAKPVRHRVVTRAMRRVALPPPLRSLVYRRFAASSWGGLARLLGEADVVYANTMGSAAAVMECRTHPSGAAFIAHLHEMGFNLDLAARLSRVPGRPALPTLLATLLETADVTLVPSEAAKADLFATLGYKWPAPPSAPKVVRGCLHTSPAKEQPGTCTVKAELGIPPDARVVIGSGTLGWTKGSDLFVQLARNLVRTSQCNLHFLWVGGWHEGEYSALHAQFQRDIVVAGLTGRFHLLPHVPSP